MSKRLTNLTPAAKDGMAVASRPSRAARRGSVSPTLVLVGLALFVAAGLAIVLTLSPRESIQRLTAVAFSPDGRFVAAGDLNGSIEVWRLPELKPEARLRLEGGGLAVLTFSPDSRVLAAAGRSVRLWNAAGWTFAREIGPPGVGYGTVRFSPDGRVLVTNNVSGRIEFWNAANGARERTLCCMAVSGDLAFSPDGARLAAGGNYPRLWELASGHEILRFVPTREPGFGAITYSPDGGRVATGSEDGTARIWQASTGQQLRATSQQKDHVESVAFKGAGKVLAFAVRKGAVVLWDTDSGAEQQVAPIATSNVAFSADGRWLGFAVPPVTLQLWDATAGRMGPAAAFPAR